MAVVNYKFNGVDADNVHKLLGKERLVTSVKKSGKNIMIGFQVRIDTNLDSLTWTTPASVGNNEVSVDWGDGTITRETANNPSHTYSSNGVYEVRWYGINTLNYNFSASGGSKTPVIAVTDWTNVRTSNMSSFPNLVDLPSTTQPTWGVQQYFGFNHVLNGPVDHWDTSATGNPQRLFKDCFAFNQPINSWNTSNFTSFLETFRNAQSFNQPLSNWDFSSATDVSSLLYGCTSFNRDIGDWRFPDAQKSTGTTNGTIVNKLVDSLADFVADGVSNGDYAKNIITGDIAIVSGVAATELTLTTDKFISGQQYRVFTGISANTLLNGCSSFNNEGQVVTGLNGWTTKNITNLTSCFSSNANFNAPVGNWDTSGNTIMRGTFSGCVSFNQDISNWDTSAVTNMSDCFSGCAVFNNGLASGATNAPGTGMDTWDVSRVTNFTQLFQNCNAFNQYLGSWNVTGLTTALHAFKSMAVFEGNGLGNWDVSSITNFDEMFFNSSNVNFAITHPNYWEINPTVTTVYNMFKGTAMNGGQAAGVSGRNCEFKFSTDPADSTSLPNLLSGIGGEFNQDISTDSVNGYWEMDRVVDMTFMLSSCSNFNQNIGNWNVGACTNFSGLFSGCANFNNGGSNTINNWDVSSALNMASMFLNCNNFDQPLGSWNVSSVTDMSSMFQNADNFDQDLSSWNTASVTTMRRMFFNRTPVYSFSIASWSIASLQNASEFINVSSAITTANYDLLLDSTTGWASQATIQSGVSLGMSTVNYTLGGNAEAGRNILTGTYGWTIVDGGGV